MDHSEVTGVLMRGPLAGSGAALQDGLGNLPNQRNDQIWGALQGGDDNVCLVHRFSFTIQFLRFADPQNFSRITEPACRFAALRFVARSSVRKRVWIEKGDEHSTQWQEARGHSGCAREIS